MGEDPYAKRLAARVGGATDRLPQLVDLGEEPDGPEPGPDLAAEQRRASLGVRPLGGCTSSLAQTGGRETISTSMGGIHRKTARIPSPSGDGRMAAPVDR
jgi:hypothetical protein